MTLIHKNGKGTGSAVRVERNGCLIRLEILNQEQDYFCDRGATISLNPVEATALVEVLIGYTEDVNDRKGIYRRADCYSTILHFNHVIEPCPAYVLTISSRRIDGGEERSGTFRFTIREGVTLRIYLERLIAEAADVY